MKKIPFIVYLITGFLITMATLYGYTLCRHRPGLPQEIKPYAEKGLLVQVNDIEIKSDQDIEFIFCRKRAGEWATFYVKTEDGVEKKMGRIENHYLLPYPDIYLVIGSFLIIMAFVVFLLRPQEMRARIFYWASLVASCSLIVNGGFYCLTKDWLSYIPGILFYAFYPLIPTLVLHFSLTFLWTRRKLLDFLIYFPAVFYIIVLEYLFLVSTLTSSIDLYRQYQSFFANLFRGYFILYFLLSFLALIMSYRRAELVEHKAQIKWILYGLFFGVGPMLFMYQFPRMLINRPLISEDLVPVFVIFILVAFGISIFRFKLMNIELIINRSLVYSILTIFTIAFYLSFVQIIQILFARFFAIQQTTISVTGAFAVALAFNPARKKIQEIVDKSFFRTSYDYKKSILSFNERAHKIARQPHLVDFFMTKVDKTIPLVYLGLRVFSAESGKRKIFIERGRSETPSRLDTGVLISDKIFAMRKSVLTELGVDFSIENWLDEKKLEMIIPIPFRTTGLTGYVELGKKKSGAKFSGDDIELLLTMIETFALNLERIHLQEEVIYERAEKEKFDELNRLKTEFISNVSHEIRTPMSSIQGMSEILQEGRIKGEKKQGEILEMMTNECSRLSRFLHNILDYGKIEMKVKGYHFQKTDISQVVEEILKLYAYRFQSLGFSVKKQIPKAPLWLNIDPDGVKQALTNLIDNAIKYSSKKREISIAIVENQKKVEIRVQDRGIGIAEQDYQKIFDGFYRISDAEQLAPKGVGLGLKIVKHIMEAHGGDIQVESQMGKGSTFILVFSR
ncbi:MAG: GHKL domain-containing protein [Candidatus Aminicenantes bacterium]|nr:MAG: GHKL domain-containing protein [Candidatus Aminicenantes bacterium]